MLQSKNRTRKLRRQELGQYKRLVKLLDTNLGAVVQQGLVWKRRYESALEALQKAQQQKPSGLIYSHDGRLIQ